MSSARKSRKKENEVSTKNKKLTLNAEQVDALRRLLEYTFYNEFEDCCASIELDDDGSCPESVECRGHIFDTIMTLGNSLFGTAYTLADHVNYRYS